MLDHQWCEPRVGPLSRLCCVHPASHPEARSRTVEQSQQAEVVVLRGRGWQLDDWGRLLEHLAATVQDEVVVRGDLAEDNGERSAKALRR